jgi:aspartyl-tRNA(Asn)/glutamyl-tRNA(Gln) amidotransferase subunit C
MITNSEIVKLSKLVKLNFSEDQISVLSNQLTSIVDMINSLNEVDCKELEPLTSVLEMTQRFRDDEVLDGNIQEEILANAPGTVSRMAKNIKCFIVPKVIE